MNIPKKAYSLLELSVVILIISLIATGALSIIFSEKEKQKVHITNDKIEIIYKALGVYLLKNQALPCPAPINLVRITNSNYGKITGTQGVCQTSGVYLNETGTQNLIYGAIPTQDLNLPADFAKDGYDNKFTYIVAQPFTNSDFTTYPNIGFGRGNPSGYITVTQNISSTSQEITQDASFLIISYGENGNGAFLENLSTSNSASTDSDEQSNYASSYNDGTNVATFDKTFVATSPDSDIFDDVLFYKTRDQMITDFKGFNLFYCSDSIVGNGTENKTYAGAPEETFTWSGSRFDYFVESDVECPQDLGAEFPYDWRVKNLKPIKKCGPFSRWYEEITVNCKDS